MSDKVTYRAVWGQLKIHNQSHDLIIAMLLKQIVKEIEVCGEMVFTQKMTAHMIPRSFGEFWSVPCCDM